MCKVINGVYVLKFGGVVRYVGSGKDITDSRKSNHLARLRSGNHNKELQKYWDEFGENEFEFEVLEQCPRKNCFERERYYKEIYKNTIVKSNKIKNTKKSIKTGLKAKRHRDKFRELNSGTNNPNCQTPTELIIKIKKMLAEGISVKEIAKITGKSESYIYNIKNGYRWSSVKLEDYIVKEKEIASIGVLSTSGNLNTLASV